MSVDDPGRKAAAGRGRPTAKRTAKDSVFRDLFTQPDYLLALYRALHPEDRETGAGDLEIVTIERVVTDGEYNDLGFTAGGRLLVLVEAQSTWSANIVTRMLLYLAETYRRRIREADASLHDGAVVALPAPELYVVYTGDRDVPDEVTFSGDVLGGAACDVDARVHVLRGGTDDVVGEYVEFARLFDGTMRDDALTAGEKVGEVMRRCAERGILEPYMERRRLEVEDIMFTLFDQERETRLYHERLKKQAQEEGHAEGYKEGRTEGRKAGHAEGRAEGRESALAESVSNLMKSQGITPDEAMDALGIPEQERPRIAELIA